MAISTKRSHISLWKLAGMMLYVGTAGYGGGPAIIAFLKQILVDRTALIDEETFVTGISLSQLLPGAHALNLVVFLGYHLQGLLGAVIAPVCFLAPATLFMTILTALYFSYGSLPVIAALFTGIGAIVIGLLINALAVMGRAAIKNWYAAGVAVLTLLLQLFLHFPVIYIILFCAVLGLLLGNRIAPVTEQDGKVTVTPPSSRWINIAAILLGIVALILIALTMKSPATTIFVSLFKVGTFTFAGGFAAIPLFQHEAIVVHHWLTNRQFLDGIALGQVTPGPVLISGTFIGYRVLGVLGALLGTIAVFLPGGLAMALLVQRHEQLSQLSWLQPLVKGVAAGFIGILLAIIIELAQQSIHDWKTLSLAIASTLVLILWKRDPLWVIVVGGVLSYFLFT